MQKEKRKIQITAAKVRGFWADSKKLARFLSELLRQGGRIATEYGNRGWSCRKIVFFAQKFGGMDGLFYLCKGKRRVTAVSKCLATTPGALPCWRRFAT